MNRLQIYDCKNGRSSNKWLWWWSCAFKMIYANIPTGFFPTFTTFSLFCCCWWLWCECHNNIYVTIIILIRILSVTVNWNVSSLNDLQCAVCAKAWIYIVYDAQHMKVIKIALIFVFQLDKNIMSVYMCDNLLIWWHCKNFRGWGTCI